MVKDRMIRRATIALGLAAGMLSAMIPASQAQGLLKHFGGRAAERPPAPPTLMDLAAMIDNLDEELYETGKIAVKSPDIWGENRNTEYRAEYEDQMKEQLGEFEVLINSYIRRSDVAALSSATSIGAAIAPGVADSENVSTTNVSIPTVTGLPSLATPAGQLIGSPSPLLDPSSLTTLALANQDAADGIGLEPVLALDQRSRFLSHLQQLRRINAGDDRTDTPGYGLYLIRMPISVLPGPDSMQGKGAAVTVTAKHDLTPDLLPNTFRNVVTLDTAYSLMEVVVRGQYLPIVLPTVVAEDASADSTDGGQANALRTPVLGPGLTAPTGATLPFTELLQVFGPENLQILVDAVKEDQQDWYRHDPSVVSWLINELGTAYSYIREEARKGNPYFYPDQFETIGELVLNRNYTQLAQVRNRWLVDLARLRGQDVGKLERQGVIVPDPERLRAWDDVIRPIDVLAYALIVQSVVLDRQIKDDMQVFAERKGCTYGDPWIYRFYEPWPSHEARAAFNEYVACKWPIHVFSLDPMVQEQNQLDLFSQRTELQLALATAIATGQVNFENATSYARRRELDLASVALNRTAVGFGAGDSTFGWQFYPRVQSPPSQNNAQLFANTLLFGGPGPDYELRKRRIEPGPREGLALMVVPNFVSSIRMTTVSNFFDLAKHHNDQLLETTEMVELGSKAQHVRHAFMHLCQTSHDRPVDQEVLSDRLEQLDAMLPLQSYNVPLPFEADLTGSEIFSSNASGLSPRLLTWYGEPPQVGKTSHIFVLGKNFRVLETKAIVGGITVPDIDLLSRNVIRIEIPDGARPIAVVGEDGRKSRLVYDLHVASPNGISNHLFVEVLPAEPAAAAAAPASAYTINEDSQTITVAYNLITAADGRRIPACGKRLAPEQLQIDWEHPTGTAPNQIQVQLRFRYKGASMTIPDPVQGQLTTTSDGGYYLVDTAGLDQVAEEFIDSVGGLDGTITVDNPIPTVELESLRITPVNTNDVYDVQAVPTTNGLRIVPVLTNVPLCPQAQDAPMPQGTEGIGPAEMIAPPVEAAPGTPLTPGAVEEAPVIPPPAAPGATPSEAAPVIPPVPGVPPGVSALPPLPDAVARVLRRDGALAPVNVLIDNRTPPASYSHRRLWPWNRDQGRAPGASPPHRGSRLFPGLPRLNGPAR